MKNLNDTIGLLQDVAELLENYSDVKDGDDGRPEPNKAMVMLREVDEHIEYLKRQETTHSMINEVAALLRATDLSKEADALLLLKQKFVPNVPVT